MNAAVNITMVVASLFATLDDAPNSISETLQEQQEVKSQEQNEFDILQEKINQVRSERQMQASGKNDPVQNNNSIESSQNTPSYDRNVDNDIPLQNSPAESVDYVQYSDLLPVGVDPNDPLIKDIPEEKLRLFKKIEKCESNGDPNIVSANGIYKGLYQFHDRTWAGIGGTEVAPSANLATPAQQLHYANKLEEAYGWSQWECAYITGII